jgi:translation elongation factor EF-G
MDGELFKLVLKVPENCIGEVLGNLNHRRAWLDTVRNENGVFLVEARIPSLEIADFKEWLKKNTNGKGETVVV